MATGTCLRTFHGYTGVVNSVCFSPDGKTLGSGGFTGDTGKDDDGVNTPGTLMLWNVATSLCLRTMKGHTDEVDSVCFSPDGKTIASGSQDQTVKIWKVATGGCLRTLTGFSSFVPSVSFSPDGKTVAGAGGEDQADKIWQVTTGDCLHTLTTVDFPTWCVCFSPDGKTLASGSEDGPGPIMLWDVRTGACLRTLPTQAPL